MKRAATALGVIALLAAPAAALAAEELFTASLTPDAEVPAVAVASSATGSARFVISADGTEVSYEVSHEGLTGDPVAAHIHYGAEAVAGAVMLPLAHGPSPMTGTLTEADFVPVDDGPQSFAEALQAIRDGNAYVNVHTEANPPGELRGQLRAADLPDTATGPVGDGGGTGIGSPILLLVVGVLALAVALRRFAFGR